ncbi:uncharacterized protein ACNS7B_000608 isoform 2-T2 [Menidia menidia]
MQRTEPQGNNFDGGFNTLICQEDLQDEEYSTNNGRHQPSVPVFSLTLGRRSRLVTLILTLLAALLLIVDISLGVHYNNLKDTHLTAEDTERIGRELARLQEDYKTAVETMKGAQKQTDSERNSLTETNWEFEHQTKRSQDNKDQIDKMTMDIAKLRSQLQMISHGCKFCPPGWFFIDSFCYYFSFSNKFGLRSWQKAQEFCQLQGGNLLVIDSKEKQKMTVTQLMTHQDPSKWDDGFWFGLRDSEEEETWKWLDGKLLVEGYWQDGEPNDAERNEDCATVFAQKNFFKSWNDKACESGNQWICEKAPTSMT